MSDSKAINPSECKHDAFHVHANIDNSQMVEGKPVRLAHFSARCKQCGSPFSFIAERAAGVFDRPTADEFGLSLTVAIVPLANVMDDFLNAGKVAQEERKDDAS